MENFFLIQYTGTNIHANCFPYIFRTREQAQQYIEESTYYPDEFVVIEGEMMDEYFEPLQENRTQNIINNMKQKQTIKLNESQLRQMIREALNSNIIKESIRKALKENDTTFEHQMSETSSVYWGKDEHSFYAEDRALLFGLGREVRGGFRRFPNAGQAKKYAEELYQNELQRKAEGRKWVKQPK